MLFELLFQVWFVGFALLLVVRTRSEQHLWHSSTRAVCEEIICCCIDDKAYVNLPFPQM